MYRIVGTGQAVRATDIPSPVKRRSNSWRKNFEPFYDQAKRYRELGMPEQETTYCMGVILGIYRYEHESKSEFRKWCEGCSY